MKEDSILRQKCSNCNKSRQSYNTPCWESGLCGKCYRLKYNPPKYCKECGKVCTTYNKVCWTYNMCGKCYRDETVKRMKLLYENDKENYKLCKTCSDRTCQLTYFKGGRQILKDVRFCSTCRMLKYGKNEMFV